MLLRLHHLRDRDVLLSPPARRHGVHPGGLHPPRLLRAGRLPPRPRANRRGNLPGRPGIVLAFAYTYFQGCKLNTYIVAFIFHINASNVRMYIRKSSILLHF